MRNIIHYLYTLLLLGAAGSATASSTAEMNSLSTAMFTFMAFSLIAFVITYLMWKFNDLKKRKVITKIINRGPVKKSAVAYIHKKQPVTADEVNVK